MIIGFLLGFISCFILFLVSYIVIREVILSKGEKIQEIIRNEKAKLEDSLKGSSILYPDLSQDIIESDILLDKIIE